MTGGPHSEADLLGEDRLARPRRTGHHHDRARLQSAIEDQVKTGDPGSHPLHRAPRPSLSRPSATSIRCSGRYGLDTTASAPTARWGSPLAARIGMPVVAGSQRSRLMSSAPPITGIIMSVTTRSGGDSPTARSAAAPSPASAT